MLSKIWEAKSISLFYRIVKPFFLNNSHNNTQINIEANIIAKMKWINRPSSIASRNKDNDAIDNTFTSLNSFTF